jgi:hypothetical protein
VGAWEASIRSPSIPFECVRLGLACENVVTSTLQPAVDTFDGEATGTLLLGTGAAQKGFVSKSTLGHVIEACLVVCFCATVRPPPPQVNSDDICVVDLRERSRI